MRTFGTFTYEPGMIVKELACSQHPNRRYATGLIIKDTAAVCPDCGNSTHLAWRVTQDGQEPRWEEVRPA